MTLIIVAVSNEQTFLCSDRRITTSTEVSDDEYNKSIVLMCDDGNFALALTGLATYGDFSMHEFLFSSLNEVTSNDKKIEEIERQLCSKLDNLYTRKLARFKNQPLQIVIAGIKEGNSQNRGYASIISNVEAIDSNTHVTNNQFHGFIRQRQTIEGGISLITAGSGTNVVHKGDIAKLRKMLIEKTDYKGIEMKLFNAMGKVAKIERTVGFQASTCTIFPDFNKAVQFSYYSNFPTRVVHSSAVIIALEEGRMSSAWGRFETGDLNPVATVPSQNKNAHCSCGSGVKYKYCHAKIQYVYLPMSCSWSSNTGKKRCIQSRGASPVNDVTARADRKRPFPGLHP